MRTGASTKVKPARVVLVPTVGRVRVKRGGPAAGWGLSSGAWGCTPLLVAAWGGARGLRLLARDYPEIARAFGAAAGPPPAPGWVWDAAIGTWFPPVRRRARKAGGK